MLTCTQRAAMVLAILAAAGCAQKISVPDSALSSVSATAGEGTVVGSILLTIPQGPTNDDQRKAVERLQQASYEETIRRYKGRGAGIVEWSSPAGPTYRVSFKADEEKPFVLHGQPGKYILEKVSERLPSGREGCTMEGIASFHIAPDESTYVGKLTITTSFMSREEVKQVRAMENIDGIAIMEMPERLVHMSPKVIDAKDDTMQAVGTVKVGVSGEIKTTLMWATDKGLWAYHPAPLGQPPGMPH